MTTSAKCSPPARRSRSRRSSTGGSSAAIACRAILASSSGDAVHEHVDVPAREPARRGDDEAGDEERRDRVASREAGRRGDEAGENGEGAGEVAPEVERVGEQRLASVEARPAQRHNVREASMARTSPIAANVHHVGSTSNSTTPASRRTAATAIPTLARMRKPASASAARFWALACPYGWPRSAGRTATETAKNVSSAAARSVPECAASASSPRLELASPATSLIATRRHAAPTETSAVRRCGDMARKATA